MSIPFAAAVATNLWVTSREAGREPTRNRPRSAMASGDLQRVRRARTISHGLSTPRSTKLAKQPPPDISSAAKPALSSNSATSRTRAVESRPASGSWVRRRIEVSTMLGIR